MASGSSLTHSRGVLQLRYGIVRLVLVALLAFLAWAAYAYLDPRGYGWVAAAAIGLIALAWFGLRWRRVRRARARDASADRWAEALMDPPRRPAATRELREEREKLDTNKGKEASRHARLTLVLAELLEANGKAKEAVEVLDEVNDEELEEVLGAIVRHARAVSHLSAGDPKAAAAALDALPGPCGDPNVDIRIRLMRGLIAAESGDTDEALEIARFAREEVRGEADLELEARVLEAVALDASGQREDALTVMARVGDDMLDVLLVLGLPRVKRLAAAVIESRDE